MLGVRSKTVNRMRAPAMRIATTAPGGHCPDWGRVVPCRAPHLAECSNGSAGGGKRVSAEQAELLRQIPFVDELLAQARRAATFETRGRNTVVEMRRASSPMCAARTWAIRMDGAGPQRSLRRRAHQHRVERIFATCAGPTTRRSDSATRTGRGAGLRKTVVGEFDRSPPRQVQQSLNIESKRARVGKREVNTA